MGLQAQEEMRSRYVCAGGLLLNDAAPPLLLQGVHGARSLKAREQDSLLPPTPRACSAHWDLLMSQRWGSHGKRRVRQYPKLQRIAQGGGIRASAFRDEALISSAPFGDEVGPSTGLRHRIFSHGGCVRLQSLPSARYVTNRVYRLLPLIEPQPSPSKSCIRGRG